MSELKIVVSVCMITYNHENFISEAIEGVLMQETKFPIELIIGEDCSTDNTRKICQEYQNKYPDKIKLLLPESNLGMMQNFCLTLKASTGKYIALCEGDDYWTDPLKLQKQVDFLELNNDYSICFHPVKIWLNNDIIEDYITSEVSETTDITDLANGNYIHTPTVVFRQNNDVYEQFKTINAPVGDYVLHMLNAKYGKIKKIPDIMAVYRVHPGGVWSCNNSEYKYSIWLSVIELLVTFFENENIIRQLKLQDGTISYILYSLYKSQDKEKSKQYFIRACLNNSELIYNKYEDRISQLENELLLVRKSKSYKTGKFILKPFSVIRNKYQK